MKIMPAPRIAVPLPTSADAAYNDRCWPQYAAAISAAGGEAVQLALSDSASEQATLVRSCQGVCLPGSPADVAPERYGAERAAETAPPDPAREATDYLLLTEAWQHNLPVLAICFGLQSLNVWRGGTLVQDLMPAPINHSAAAGVGIAHTALIAADSLLGKILLADDASRREAPADDGYLRLPINSSHHQAVLAPGDGLRIAARAPSDGVVEALIYDGPSEERMDFVLGVQWHPERSFSNSAASRAIFMSFLEAARCSAAQE